MEQEKAGIFGEALDTFLQAAQDARETDTLLRVLERMCDRQQIKDARDGRSIEFSVIYIEDIRTACGFAECFEAKRIAGQRAEAAE